MDSGVAPAASLTDFSASRLGVINRCGAAFEFQYVRNMPAPYDKGQMLLGNVIHDGVAEWYGPDEAPNDYQNVDLVPLVCARWADYLPPVVWQKIQAIQRLDEECDAVASAVSFKRPEIKAPRTTKEFLASGAAKRLAEAKTEMLSYCDALQEVKWPRDEDPYKAYVKAAEMAAQMQDQWKDKPRPLAVERPFSVEFEGFHLRGRIDQVRADPAPGTGELLSPTLDIKTGKQPLTQMEAFIQMFIYWKARQTFDDLPASDVIEFYLTRHQKIQRGSIDGKRHERLASRILNGRARQIAMGQFEPAYGYHCKTCDFSDLCSSEISLWKDDGLVPLPIVNTTRTP
jgi:hypothetical protein